MDRYMFYNVIFTVHLSCLERETKYIIKIILQSKKIIVCRVVLVVWICIKCLSFLLTCANMAYCVTVLGKSFVQLLSTCKQGKHISCYKYGQVLECYFHCTFYHVYISQLCNEFH